MGKYIQPNKRPVAPIFPQMPGGQQRMNGRPAQPQKRREEEKPRAEAVVNQEKKVQANAAPPSVKSNTKKKMTVEDLRNGFKMSVIIGDPVSKKYRKTK